MRKSFRITLGALAALGVMALGFPRMSQADSLVFSQDTFVYEDSEPSLSMTVELFGIDEATSSFRFTASGTITNFFWDYSGDEDAFTYFPATSFHLFGEFSESDPVTYAVVDWSFPDGPGVFPEADGAHCFGVGAYASGSAMCAGFPTLASPFDWSATFEITVPELDGSYRLESFSGRDHAWQLPDGSWEILGGQVAAFISFEFSIIPEPTTALLLATGLAGLAAAGRRRRS